MKDWSTFGDEVRQNTAHRGPKCAVSVLLDRLDDKARPAVLEALGDRGITNAAIQKALRERLGDLAPSLFSVSNHRRGMCRCSRNGVSVTVQQ